MLILVLMIFSNLSQNVYMLDKVSSLKPTPLFPPILEVIKVDLKERIVEDNIIEQFMIKKYLFIIFHYVINATYHYNLTVFDIQSWNKTYEETFFKSSVFERIYVFYDEDELVIISKSELLYMNVADRDISRKVISLASGETFIDSHIGYGYIIVLTNSRLFVFGYGSFKATSLESEYIGSIMKVKFRKEWLVLATQVCKISCALNVMAYSLVNDTLIPRNKLKIDLASFVTDSKIYLDLDRVEIVNSGKLTVSYINGSITTSFLVPEDSVIFESFYDNEILLVTRNKTSKEITYWFFRNNQLLRRLDLDDEDSIYTLINASVGYRSIYDEETGIITIYGFSGGMLAHELVGDEGFTRMLYLVRTIGYERVNNAVFFPHYRIFLITSEKLGVERYAYLYTIDANFVYSLGYLTTKPGVNIVNGRLSIVFVTLEYGIKKILICFIDKPSVLLLRGIKSSISYRDQYNRSVVYLYGGGAMDLLILPSGKGFLRIVSRTCYDGPEELYALIEMDLKSDRLNFLNTTIYSGQLSYVSSTTVNALFMDKNNSTRTFTLTINNKGVCYIPPGEYIVEAYRVETGMSIKTTLKINTSERAEINFDELFNQTYASSVVRNKSSLVMVAMLIFIVIVLILFIRSIIVYRKQTSLYS